MENFSYKLQKFKLELKQINKLNDLLNIDNIEDFFVLLEKYFINWKKIYQKFWNTIENKEKVLLFILNEILNLFNKLNVRRIHNSSEWVNIRKHKYENLKQLEDFFRIRWIDFLQQPKKWFSCNIFMYYFYWLLKDITQNDGSITYFFELNKFDNHGKLVLKINNNTYNIDSVDEWIKIKKINKTYNKFSPVALYDDVHKYMENSIIWQLKKNTTTYQYGRYRLKIYKIAWKIFFIFYTSPRKKINIKWFKKLSKYAQEFINLQPIWKINDINKIKQKIIKFWKTDKEKQVLNKILEQIDEEKTKSFIN